MMIKSFLIGLSLVFLFLNEIKSLKVDVYENVINELLTDIEFVEAFSKRSSELFADPDYYYGRQPSAFPCPIPSTQERNDPITVHNLRPSDVQCIAGVGDSMTAALGARAKTAIGLLTEYRGLSWSIGGDESYETVLTIPNILKKYNPNVKGFSTKTTMHIFKGQNGSHNALNVAQSGDECRQMLGQTKMLHDRFLTKEYCDIDNDWKVITLFVGGNDLCVFCNDELTHTPEDYVQHVREALDYLQANFPRTFVNLALLLDVRNVKEMNDGLVCTLMHKKTCPCAAYPTESDTRTLDDWFPKYHEVLVDLINSGRYDTKDDFTVVIQPFFAHTGIPLKDGQIDYSYFAPDCFHMSAKGQTKAALSLWNNMLEPVGQKRWEWHVGEQIECPTQDRPFFATRKNSPTSFEKIPESNKKK